MLYRIRVQQVTDSLIVFLDQDPVNGCTYQLHASGHDFKELPSEQEKRRVRISPKAEPWCNWGCFTSSRLPVLDEIQNILGVVKAAILEETVTSYIIKGPFFVS